MRKRQLLGAVVALLIVAPSAHAEIRKGFATDPAGDSSGAPGQDLTSASATYDTNGAFSVAAIMAGPVASAGSFVVFSIGSLSGDSCAPTVSAKLDAYALTDGTVARWQQTGYSPATGGLYVGDDGLGIAGSGGALVGLDYRCVRITVASKTGDTIYDQLDVPLYFDGYGPATPTPTPVVAPAPTPAPAAGTPVPPPVDLSDQSVSYDDPCDFSDFVGETLAHLKHAIHQAHGGDAGCLLGEVKTPKKPKAKGTYKLVVKHVHLRPDGSKRIDVSMKWQRVKAKPKHKPGKSS